jgi:hypothetical protein
VASDPDYSEFGRDGADAVIKNLTRDAYDSERRKLAIAWLEDLERSSEARRAAMAWRVGAAKRTAVAVLVLAVVAIIFAVYGIFPYAK